MSPVHHHVTNDPHHIGIEQFVGSWVSESGGRLSPEPVSRSSPMLARRTLARTSWAADSATRVDFIEGHLRIVEFPTHNPTHNLRCLVRLAGILSASLNVAGEEVTATLVRLYGRVSGISVNATRVGRTSPRCVAKTVINANLAATRALLGCDVAASLLFLLIFTTQILLRPEVRFTRSEPSLLSLGPLG